MSQKPNDFELLGHDSPLGRYPAPIVPIGRKNNNQLVAVYLDSPNSEPSFISIDKGSNFVQHNDNLKELLSNFDCSKDKLFAFSENQVRRYKISNESDFFKSILDHESSNNLSETDTFFRLSLAKATSDIELITAELKKCGKFLLKKKCSSAITNAWYQTEENKLSSLWEENGKKFPSKNTILDSSLGSRVFRRVQSFTVIGTSIYRESLRSINNLRPQALLTRLNAAAKIAFNRRHPRYIANSEEFKYTDSSDRPTYIANFTKGLPHDLQTGIIADPADYQQFVQEINSGDVQDFKDTPLGPPGMDGVEFPEWQSQIAQDIRATVRAWESQGVGLTFDLEGPDAQAVTMPPAPALDSQELVTEMLEVYLMALLRDVPFAKFGETPAINEAIERLNNTIWIRNPESLNLSPAERSRLRQPFNLQTVFRGITPGDKVGPYISQFLLVGNQGLGNIDDLSDGFISYGSLRIDQRVPVAEPNKDYMTTWEAWLDVQNGADVRGLETYMDDPGYRFIATPRDIATYVHVYCDALYEAYLNACIILLGLGVSFNPGIPFQAPDFEDEQQGFAQFGGPHILSLVTEVATRAFKAVWFQKFNVHRRLRPEVVGGWINRFNNGDTQNLEVMQTLVDGLGADFLDQVAAHNRKQNERFGDRQGDANNGYANSFLLPMAFPEGSPMHPAYGADHATVAGACVTILKAFFDTDATLPFCYQANSNGTQLEKVSLDEPLTVGGELDKLAANISIGRNWAGVHYFSDYIESWRLGERIAIGILEEQKLTYGENFSMTIPLFDGGSVTI